MAEAETRGRGVEALWRLGIGGGLDAGGGGGGGTLFGGGARDEFFFLVETRRHNPIGKIPFLC